MHSVFALQRMLALERQRAGDAGAPALLSVRDVVAFATIQGAIDNHLDRQGRLAHPGKEADIILLQTRAINVVPVNNAYGAVVLGMNTANVDTVLVSGATASGRGSSSASTSIACARGSRRRAMASSSGQDGRRRSWAGIGKGPR
jgi:5-methylthioadenosine/S-adenosylhomocysteine deaminase